ncbi:hypothetical protein C7C46_00795 [Streptomyces tateyamensis]|uniref:Uncharacterized protein n=1 Tax=Streptomyces tateyamensis TaxID=565073 RepID=A0A2V4PPE4_9ACTN|nr:hypothetical protein [Streptomyces tateyamensis]PYC88220.1 hypothetical protein C7C46_00795 [Streptomyces tateyamensis]
MTAAPENALEAAFHGLLDDAAVFPPGDLPLAQAVPAHQLHRSAWYAPFVGSFVCPATRAGEVDAPLELSLTLPDGPSGLAGVLAAPDRRPLGRLVAVEVALPAAVPAAEAVALLDAQLPEDVTGFVEVPRDERQSAVLDALSGTRHRAKFRTGGLVPQAHPDEAELAGSLLAAVRRELPFKCTAGLHHAVRHTDGTLEQHGFLNVLLATAAALYGATQAQLAQLLAERDPQQVARQVVAAAADGRLAQARTRFLSFGTCSITDPLTDLTALGLVHRPQETDA